jgi:hypothetical protein
VPTRRDYPESPPVSDAIGFEVVMVDREHRCQRFAVGQMHEGRVREVHGPLTIADHQGVQGGKIRVPDRADRDRARAKKCPRGIDFTRVVSGPMKQLRHRIGVGKGEIGRDQRHRDDGEDGQERSEAVAAGAAPPGNGSLTRTGSTDRDRRRGRPRSG